MTGDRIGRAVRALLGRRRAAQSIAEPPTEPAESSCKLDVFTFKPPDVIYDSKGRPLPVKLASENEILEKKVERVRQQIRRVNNWWSRGNLQ